MEYNSIKEELSKRIEDNDTEMTERAYDIANDDDLHIINDFMHDLKTNITFNSDNTLKALQVLTLPSYNSLMDNSKDYLDLWRLFDYCPMTIYRTNKFDLFAGDIYVIAYQVCDVLNDIRYYIVDAK